MEHFVNIRIIRSDDDIKFFLLQVLKINLLKGFSCHDFHILATVKFFYYI